MESDRPLREGNDRSIRLFDNATTVAARPVGCRRPLLLSPFDGASLMDCNRFACLGRGRVDEDGGGVFGRGAVEEAAE